MKSQKETIAKNPKNILKGVSSEVNITRKQELPNSKANTQFCSEKRDLNNSAKERVILYRLYLEGRWRV